jgi:predicted acetyltransferase
MKLRKATTDDLERLVEIHLAAYPDARSVEARQRNFTRHPFGTLAHLHVLEVDGAIVAHAFLFPFRASFGGRLVNVGGIGSVGVAPEARGRGMATALMNGLHVVSDARGDALTMLYAFRHGFYGRLGYATTSSRKRLTIDTRAIPAAWRELARRRIRAAAGADRRPIRDVHRRRVERSSGWIDRPARLWEHLFSRERLIFLVCDRPAPERGLSGYVAFTITQEEPHGETTLEVEALVADDGESRRALLGALGAMRDQVSELVLDIAEGDPLERALVDPDGRRHGTEAVEHGLGHVVGGPMVRLEDVPRAIAARGYAADGAFDLVIEDARQTLIAAGVRVKSGTAEVGPPRGGSGRALRTTRAGLGAILYGGLAASDAVALGLAEGEAATVRRVDAIARMHPLDPIDAF